MRLTLADIRQDLARIADLAARLDAEMPEANATWGDQDG